MKEEILAQHECFWANQHQAVSIISVKNHPEPWTLRVDMGKCLGTEDENTEFNIDIKYCPFCGQLLDT